MADLDSYRAPDELARIRTIFLGLGGIAFLAWLVGMYLQPEQGLRSWLVAFLFWGGLTIGSTGIIMLQYLTGGAWGVVIRRVVEAASRTLPLVALAFIPLLWVTKYHYWTTWPATDYAIAHRGWFMTPESWILRSVIYFVVFGIIVYLLNKWSVAQDRSADHKEAARWLGRATAFSGPTMVFFVLTVTFATVDWAMMLDAHWFSTMWGLLFTVGWSLSAFCLAVALLAYLSDKAPMNRVLGKRHFHDLGKLMLALVMVWTYFNFSQYLIIFSGNIPEETTWYITRLNGGWQYVGLLLLVFHFAFPFLILLQQDFKRRMKQLAWLAVFILVMRAIDIFYLVAPNPRIDKTIEKGAFIISWMDFAALLGLGGIWLWYFLGQYISRPLVPVMDPFLEKAIEHGHGH